MVAAHPLGKSGFIRHNVIKTRKVKTGSGKDFVVQEEVKDDSESPDQDFLSTSGLGNVHCTFLIGNAINCK